MQAGLVTIQLCWWLGAFQPNVATFRSLHSLRLDDLDRNSVFPCLSLHLESFGHQLQFLDWIEDLEVHLELFARNKLHVYDVVDEAEEKGKGVVDKVEKT